MSFDPGPDEVAQHLPSDVMDLRALVADPCLFCRTSAEILGVSGVGLTLLDGVHLYGQLAASDDIAVGLEWTEFALGEGPRATAARTGSAVLEGDITAAEDRYPLFAQAARLLGANAIFIFPVGSSLSVIATLSLYNCTSGDLSRAQFVAASMLVAAAAPMILSATSADTTGEAAPPSSRAWAGTEIASISRRALSPSSSTSRWPMRSQRFEPVRGLRTNRSWS